MKIKEFRDGWLSAHLKAIPWKLFHRLKGYTIKEEYELDQFCTGLLLFGTLTINARKG